MSAKLVEFGDRLVTLNTGAYGIRGGMRCECKATSATEPVLEFIGSDGSVDRYNEVIDQKGWDLSNFRANPVIPDCHDYSSIARILGRARSVEVKDGKLVNEVEFCTENPLGMMAWKMSKAGFIKSQSVGFIPLEWTNGIGRDQPDRTFTKCELLEISLVVVPANPGATVGLAYKSGALDKGDLQNAAEFFKQFSQIQKADPAGKPGACAAGVHDAQLLRVAQELERTLRRA
jgi:HK97 family phage prohead protease